MNIQSYNQVLFFHVIILFNLFDRKIASSFAGNFLHAIINSKYIVYKKCITITKYLSYAITAF